MPENFHNLLKKHKINKTDRFHIKSNSGQIIGPVTVDEIATLIQEGKITEEDSVSPYPQKNWQNIVFNPFFYDLILFILGLGQVPTLKKDIKHPSKREREDKTIRLEPFSKKEGSKTIVKKQIIDISPIEKKSPQKKKKSKKWILGLSIFLVTLVIVFIIFQRKPTSFLSIKIPPIMVKKMDETAALELFKKGSQLFQEDTLQAYKEALPLFHKSLEHNPNQIKKALSYLVLNYLSLWDLTSKNEDEQKNLSQILLRITQTKDDFPEYYATSCLFEITVTKNFNEAHQIIKQGLSQFPDNAYLNYLAGKLAWEDGDKIAAVNYFNQSLKQDPYFIKTYFDKALIYTKDNNWDKAEEILQEGIDIHPSHIASQLELTIIQYIHHKELSVAKDNLQNILKKPQLLFSEQRAKAHFYLGKIFQDIKSFDLALQNYKKATTYDPTNTFYSEAYKTLTSGGTIALPEAHKQDASYFISLGLIHLKQKEYLTAIEKFHIASAIDSDNFEPYYYLGEVYSSMPDRHTEQAIEAYEKAIRLKSHAPSYIKLAELYLEQYHFKKAKDLLHKAEKIDRNLPQFYFVSGQYFSKMGQFDQAVLQFQKALAQNPADTKTLWSLANTLVDKKDYDKADEYLKKLIEEDKHFYQAHNKRAEIKIRQGYPKTATTYLEALIKSDSKNAYFTSGLAQVYLVGEKYSFARKYALQAISQNPKIADPYYVLGGTYLKENKLLEAVQIYTQIKEIEPKDPKLYFTIAKLYITEAQKQFHGSICGEYRYQCEQNKIQLPIALCQNLLKKCYEPENKQKLMEVGNLFREADSVLIKLIGNQTKKGLNPNYPLAHYLRGQTYADQGDQNSAIKAFLEEERISKETENNIELSQIFASIADSYFYSNRYKEAIPYYEKAIQSKKELKEAYLKLGTCYLFVNQLELSESYLKTAQKYNPEESQVYYFLAQIYKTKGAKDQAIEELKNFLRTDPFSPLRVSIQEDIEELEKF